MTPPRTPPTYTGCRCIGRCRCTDAPKRPRSYTSSNKENIKPYPFIVNYDDCPRTPPHSEQKSCPWAPKKRRP